MSERELVELMKEVKEKFPNEFFETIGFMKGLRAIDKGKKILKSDVEHGTRQESTKEH